MFDFPLALFFLHLYSPFYRYCPFVKLLEADWKRPVLPHPTLPFFSSCSLSLAFHGF